VTRAELEDILIDITFRDWWFEVQKKGDGFLMQARFMAPDANNPDSGPTLQTCRKWYVSSHSVKAEIVRTAWKAIEAAVLHEAQEEFRYKGKVIYNPHLDPDQLAAGDQVLNVRP
jgi:hypothetical protein